MLTKAGLVIFNSQSTINLTVLDSSVIPLLIDLYFRTPHPAGFSHLYCDRD